MSAFYDLNKTPRNILLNQAIVRAIISENNGAWFDPSDLSTLYQDAAGTTPVTAVEQPVGKMLDKSGNGYHATQSITASRPTLSARKNILLATETLATQSVTTLAAQYTLSFIGTGSVTLSGTATGTLTGTVTDRISLTFTPTAGTLTLTVSGSVTKAQIELGAAAGPYQRVTTTTDYDTDERYFKKYLRFDGVDDYLNLPYMGLYAAGSASVVMGVDDRTQTVNSRVFSESSSTTSSQYSMRNTTETGIDSYVTDDAGALFVDTLNTKGTESKNYIISAVDTGTNITRYRNSTYENVQYYSRAGKTFTANKTTIGALDTLETTAAYTAMNLYGLIITKSALTDSQRVACERYLGRKSGVQL